LFIRFRRFPILCLVLASLVAWPDSFPLAAIDPPCAAGTEARPLSGQDGASFNRARKERPLQWSRGSTTLDDGEDADGRQSTRGIAPALPVFVTGLPSLIPPSAPPILARSSLARGAFAGDRPLRC
jgi:hypothetical protein